MIPGDASIRNLILPSLPSSQNNSGDAVRLWICPALNSEDSERHAGASSDRPESQISVVGSNEDAAANAADGQQAILVRNDSSITIRAEVERLVRASSRVGVQSVDCEIHEGNLIIRGNVPSFHAKQTVQEIARKVVGVNRIVNRLRVDRSQLSEALRTDVPIHSFGMCSLVSE